MFLGSKNPLLIFLQKYHVWVTSKIQVDFRSNTYPEVLVIVFCRFWNFFTIYVFEVSESFDDIPTELLCLEDLKNSGHLLVQEVFEVTQTFVPWQKCSKFISSRAKVAGRSHDQRFIVNFIVMSCNVMSCHATLCHVMSRHVTSCHVMPRHVTSCYVMPRQVTSCYVMSCNFTSCHAMSRHATSRRVPIPYRISGI